MTPSILTNYAANRLQQIKNEIQSLDKAICMNSIYGASPERINKLQQTRRYYQLVLAQARKEGVK